MPLPRPGSISSAPTSSSEPVQQARKHRRRAQFEAHGQGGDVRVAGPQPYRILLCRHQLGTPPRRSRAEGREVVPGKSMVIGKRVALDKVCT